MRIWPNKKPANLYRDSMARSRNRLTSAETHSTAAIRGLRHSAASDAHQRTPDPVKVSGLNVRSSPQCPVHPDRSPPLLRGEQSIGIGRWPSRKGASRPDFL
jgi:hypothetical protein